MNKVVAARPNDDSCFDLKFNDSSLKGFDAKPYIDYQVFQELKDLKNFREVKLAFGTVQWPHEKDVSPDTLYLEGVNLTSSVFDDYGNAA